MAKFKIGIRRIEYYSSAVVVEADNLDEAVKKVEAAWSEKDYLYEKTTDIIDDSETHFDKLGLASEEDAKWLINL